MGFLYRQMSLYNPVVFIIIYINYPPQVDNYETQEYNFNVKESADAQFNNIQYMYIGRNESMNEGFVGCVSRVEFDDIYPLKLLFQQDPPPNVRSLGGKEDDLMYCFSFNGDFLMICVFLAKGLGYLILSLEANTRHNCLSSCLCSLF